MKTYAAAEVSALKKADLEYFLHPTSSITVLEEKGPKIIAGGQGCKLYDVEGKEYIDGTAGLWFNIIGNGRTEIAEVAREQIETLQSYHAFNEFSNVPVIKLAEKVASMVPIEKAKVFFTSSGSESNDSIFKIVRFYWYTKGKDSKDYIITRDKAYHGVTCGAVQATRLPNFHEGFEPLLPGFDKIDAPYCYLCPWEKEYPDCSLECASALEAKIVEIGAEKVAAFIAEPVMGTGGVIVPPPGYYQRIREICDQYDVLLIADEVINGFGRTGGKMFGIEHWEGVVPDIMTIAKGITSGYVPLGAAVVSDEIFQGLRSKGKLFHGFTYSAHTLACQVALRNIAIIEDENLKENAAKMGERLRAGLENLNCESCGEVRGMGLMTGVDLVKNRATKEKFTNPLAPRVVEIAYENGLICRPLAGDIIQLSPPLVISEEEIDAIIAILGDAIFKAEQEYLAEQ